MRTSTRMFMRRARINAPREIIVPLEITAVRRTETEDRQGITVVRQTETEGRDRAVDLPEAEEEEPMEIKDLIRTADRIRMARRVTETAAEAIRIAATNLAADSTARSTVSIKKLRRLRKNFAAKSPESVRKTAARTADSAVSSMHLAARNRSVLSTLRRTAARKSRTSSRSRSRKRM